MVDPSGQKRPRPKARPLGAQKAPLHNDITGASGHDHRPLHRGPAAHIVGPPGPGLDLEAKKPVDPTRMDDPRRVAVARYVHAAALKRNVRLDLGHRYHPTGRGRGGDGVKPMIASRPEAGRCP